MTDAQSIAAEIEREARRLRRIGKEDEAARLHAIGVVERRREAIRQAVENSTVKARPRFAA